MTTRPRMAVVTWAVAALSVATLLLADQAHAFLTPSLGTRPQGRKSPAEDEAARKAQEASVAPTPQYLQELPDKVRHYQGTWEYALIERIEPPAKTGGGLFLPVNQDDPKYVVRVVTVGTGQVGESGVTTANQSLKPGDYAYIKQPWGIGPRDEVAESRKFSFVRYKDILGVIPCQ